MLTTADVKKLLNAGAGARIEILTMTMALGNAERMSRVLVAMANTRGGVLLVPIKPTKKGATANAEDLLDAGVKALLTCEPRLIAPLPYVVNEGDTPLAMVIEIPEGLPNVYSLEGRHFARKENRNALLTARPLRELILLRSEGTWESSSPSGSSKDDLDWKKIEDYANKLASSANSAEELMLTRGCVVGSRKLKPTFAGLLLFGKQPQRWIRGADILAARYKGAELDDAFARQTITGTLPEQIRKAEAFLIEHMSVQSTMKDWQRSDDAPYPASALREAVVNAVAHRDYRLPGNQIHVLMFADRVEVKSPGKLPGYMTLKNILKERYSRNEALVQVLADMGFIERLGYGIDRMLRVMKERSQPEPKFEESDAGFTVTLFARKTTAEQIQSVAPQNAQQTRLQKLVDFVKDNGRISSRDYQELCSDVNAETLRRDFVEMVERGVLMRVGDKRGTYYILK